MRLVAATPSNLGITISWRVISTQFTEENVNTDHKHQVVPLQTHLLNGRIPIYSDIGCNPQNLQELARQLP
jgi:hypothetical protein